MISYARLTGLQATQLCLKASAVLQPGQLTNPFWRMMSTQIASSSKKDAKKSSLNQQFDDDDDPFPSEITTASNTMGSAPAGMKEDPGGMGPLPSFFFISGGAAASAFLAIGVAGAGMIGMFVLGNFINQVVKSLKSSNSKGDIETAVAQSSSRLPSADLAQMLKVRREELEAELKLLRSSKPKTPESKSRVLDATSELGLLRTAAIGESQWSLWGR